MAALMLTALLAPILAQSSSRFQDLTTELAARIAGALTATEQVTLTIADGDDQADRRQLREALALALKARGVRLAEQGNGTSVAVSCDENLRERACLAEIRRGATREVVGITRAHDRRTAVDRPALLSLELRPLFGQRAPILDVATIGDRLFVLDPASVTLYRRGDAGWQRVQSQPIASSRPWPRDVRGRLRVDGAVLEALLPGVACHAGLDLNSMTCVDERQSWPLGIDNTGVDASRNHFTTPEGLSFFGAAALGDDGAGARWLLADQSGGLILLDAARRTMANAGAGDDVVAMSAPCAPATHVLVSSPSPNGRPDTLRLFRVVQRQLLPAALPLELPGAVTALWAAPRATVATVVTRDVSAERYEAFQIAIACDR